MLIELDKDNEKVKSAAFICFSSSYGGLELSVLRIASGFRARNIRPIIIVPLNTPLSRFAKEQNFQIVHIQPKIKYGDVFAVYKLAQVFKKEKVDIALIMQSKDIHIASIAKMFYSKIRLYFYQEMQSGIDKKDFFHTWVYSKLTKWITLTERMKIEAAARTNFSANNIIAIPIGTDMNRFNPLLYDPEKVKREFDFPKDKKIIGTLGRLDPMKGQEELIRAIPMIIKKKPDAFFVFVGDTTADNNLYGQRLVELCQLLRLNSYVKFVPFTDRTPEILSAFDIFVLPSHSETFGFVLIEAMAMGKPVIGTNAGGVPEIIQHNVNGLLIPPRDASALAQKIIALLDSPETCFRLSQQAQKDVRDKFDFNTTIDQLILLLSENNP